MATATGSSSDSSSDSDSSSSYSGNDSDTIVSLDYREIQPYLFEPIAVPRNNDIPKLPINVVRGNSGNRIGSTTWCTCSHCPSMDTEEESVCCKEIARIVSKMQTKQCITEHPGFLPSCTNPYVLEIAYLQYKQCHGRMQKTLHQKYRYTGYRQLVRWCWGFLGKKVRVPLPACAIAVIRETYPAEGTTDYQGFKWPELD